MLLTYALARIIIESMAKKIPIWNVCDRATGVCVYQVAANEKPQKDGYEVRLAVLRVRRPGDYSDKAQQRAEAGYGE